MNSLKKALACLSALAIIFVSFSCRNASDDAIIDDIANNGGNNDNNVSGAGVGQVVNGLGFDLSNAKSFFAGKASSSTASRAIDDNSVILMKIMDDDTIAPAMDFKGDNINFNLSKILKNPTTKELFLLGYFNKWSSGYYDDNGNYVESDSWSYNLIRVSQNGDWYGFPNFENIQVTQEPFDEEGNFYFQRTDYSSSTTQSNIYKYSGGTAIKIVEKANLKRVLPNGAIIYSIDNSGINNKSFYYIRLRDGKVRQLDDYSTSVYIKDKNIFYYSIKYIRGGENNYYVDDAGNKYNSYEGSYYGTTTYYANKGGKKIYVTEDGDSWKDENGKTYDSHVFSGYETRYWNFNDAGKKIYLTHIYINCYVDSDGNRYGNYDKYEYGHWVINNKGEKIVVEQFYDETNYDWRWKDSEGNIYDYPEVIDTRYYVLNDTGKKIEVEHIYDDHYEDDNGNKYDSCDKSEHKQWYWVYDGGELVEVEYKNGSYKDADGNEYEWDNEVYSVYDNNTYYYVTINGQKVTVKPAQTYSTDVIVAKYYDFIANTTAEATAEADFSGYDSYNFDTSSENVFGTTFITNSVGKFEIQKDFSLKCEYNLSEKGYTVATVWNNDYNFIGENSNRYLEKFLYSGDKIYFLGTKGDRWSSDSTYNLYKIIRSEEPKEVLSRSDASNYTFNGNITFDDDGNFIGSVLRNSDGKWGTLSGSMEYGTYEFKEDSIFESVKDIVINFD